MNFIQLSSDLSFMRDLPNSTLIHWNSNHYCTVEALVADGYAEFFNVVSVTPTAPPNYNNLTHKCERNGAELVNGSWQYSWEVIERTPEEIVAITEFNMQQVRQTAKAQRELAVSQITVTTSTGKTFDGDETSQTRMARAIIALQATGTPETVWVLADNTPTMTTVAELSEALALAGAAQAAIWVI